VKDVNHFSPLTGDPFQTLHANGSNLLILVPHRDREHHLIPFLKKTTEYFINDKVDKYLTVTIGVIHQDDNKPFNRGALLNAGYRVFSNDQASHVCFHDVDVIPIMGDYRYGSFVHVYPKYWRGIHYSQVVICSTETFETVNGYSNDYWGWGNEDIDLQSRVHHQLNHGIESRPWTSFTEFSHVHSSLDKNGRVLERCLHNHRRYQMIDFKKIQPGLKELEFSTSDLCLTVHEKNVQIHHVNVQFFHKENES